ncbi:flagellar motor switch protein FliM [Galbitalea soli]|uniref:Flagellar motor switch protein FliM n=1 Tax=Galbitalea soli TaxID=1268042 RepID=A0A7C9PMX3_9MICO|nr:flagellar motor switch protein FliM [Galbitalea soli]NEM91185.1 hypothetical protein [Galbitalea soli]NYJ29874.1 flagellar motor switch protein FliM [Galbitalea soli]
MTVQESVGAGVLAPARPEVEVYDFQRPTTLAREQSRALSVAFETFARQWGTQLTAMTRTLSSAVLDTVTMQRYDDYAAALPDTTAMVLCDVEDHLARAVIEFPTATGLSWVGRMLGGTGALEAPTRGFTAIEQTIIRRLVDYVIEDLKYSLGSLLPAELSVDTIHYNAQVAQAAATADFMLVAQFTVIVAEDRSTASIAIPADAMLPHLTPLGAIRPQGARPDPTRVQLDTVPVAVSLQLQPAIVGPADILGLVEGDLIALPHPQHRPLNVAVDGHVVARAAVGANGSRLACVVVDLEESK